MDEGNELVWEIFLDVASQARVAGMGGVIGFDHSTLPFLFAVHSVPESDWWITLKKLNVVYTIALANWNKTSESK